jgi:hypothetical protein
MVVSRRRFLVGAGVAGVVVVGGGAGAYVLVEQRVLPGKATLDRLTGACGSPGPVPDVATGPVVTGRFASTARNGADVGWMVQYPPGTDSGDRLPVCLALHGRGAHHADAHDALHLGRFLAAAVTDGQVPPFAIVSVDGGGAVNWHRRADGDDPVAMLDAELLPTLVADGLDTARPALWGWSLGGTGALYLASTDVRPWAGAVAASPVLWRDPGDWQLGAYDDDADFERTSPWRRLDRLVSVPLGIDCGGDDVLVDDVEAFRGALHPTPAGGIEPGCHDTAFWLRAAPAELEFVGRTLAAV